MTSDALAVVRLLNPSIAPGYRDALPYMSQFAVTDLRVFACASVPARCLGVQTPARSGDV